LTHDEAIDSLSAQIRAKSVWLDDHGWGAKKRPAHEIAVKETEIEALKMALRVMQSTPQE
jgi:hypothetical protein